MDNKYTEFIENYLKNDKTQSAIMLTGGWGTGKSFYIQNILTPYLDNKQEGCCIVISLYGLSDLKDISKAIYLEARTKKLNKKLSKWKIFKKDESKEQAKIVGKSIVKGVTSFFNIDFSSNEEDLQKLFESIDLSGKLIILEDLERTNISIKDVLGYVNNLVEQDGVKVLLVANEKEILKNEQVIVGKDKKGNDTKEWRWTAETQEYLKIKEKTISDTIPYVCDYFQTIENILHQFKDEAIEALLVDKLGDLEKKQSEPQTDEELQLNRQMLYVEIMSVADKIYNLNLRSLIFACQKTVDILRVYNKNIDMTFAKHIFIGIVAFSFRLKANDMLHWDDKETGYSLGTSKYPLYKFAHDYIKYQNLDIKEIENEEKSFLEQKSADTEHNHIQFCLNILYNFHSTTSALLESAIIEIKRSLEDTNAIDVLVYGKLANYLILARELIKTPSLIDDCKEIMKNNLKDTDYDGDKANDNLSFHDRFECWTSEQKNEYTEFITDMQAIIKNKRNNELDFDYKVENIDDFIKDIIKKRSDYLDQHTFLNRIDIDKLIDIIKQCTSEQIDNLRRAFGTIYSFSNVYDYFMDDKASLLKLKDSILSLLSSEDNIGDKIKRLQLSWFADNLNDILNRLH